MKRRGTVYRLATVTPKARRLERARKIAAGVGVVGAVGFAWLVSSPVDRALRRHF